MRALCISLLAVLALTSASAPTSASNEPGALQDRVGAIVAANVRIEKPQGVIDVVDLSNLGASRLQKIVIRPLVDWLQIRIATEDPAHVLLFMPLSGRTIETESNSEIELRADAGPVFVTAFDPSSHATRWRLELIDKSSAFVIMYENQYQNHRRPPRLRDLIPPQIVKCVARCRSRSQAFWQF